MPRLGSVWALCALVKVAAVGLGAVEFHLLHSVELVARNGLIVHFRLPPDAADVGDPLDLNASLRMSRTRELVFDPGGGPCSAVSEAPGLVLSTCHLRAGGAQLDLRLASPLLVDTAYTIELRVRNLAAAGLRICTESPALGGEVFVKTGGILDETSPAPPGGGRGDLNSTLDRCCRKDAETCHRFRTAEDCEAARLHVVCLPCADAGDLGCPEAQPQVDGYMLHLDELLCPDLLLAVPAAATVADVADCAGACAAGACRAFAMLPGGRCVLSSAACCPGDPAALPWEPRGGALVYSVASDCGGLGAARARASLDFAWRRASGVAAASGSGDVAIHCPSGQSGLLRAAGLVAAFSVEPVPDIGLIAPASGAVTIEVSFRLGASGEAPGDVLLFAPMPLSPWDFGVASGTPLEGNTFASAPRAALLYADVPGVLRCTWHAAAESATGGANSVRCVASDTAGGTLGRRAHTLVLSLPRPRGAGSFAWVLAHSSAPSAAPSGAPSGSAVALEDVVAFAASSARLELISSAVQVPESVTVLHLSFAFGVRAASLEATIAIPDRVLGAVTACGPVELWPFPAAEAIALDTAACRLTGVATGDPGTEYRLRLSTQNRGVLPGARGLFAMILAWEGRRQLLSTQEHYAVVAPFVAFGAVAAVRTRGLAAPLVVHFRAGEGACETGLVLQLAILRPDRLLLRSALGGPLEAVAGPARCGDVLLELSGGAGSVAAPSSCRWGAMTSAGDVLAIMFPSGQALAGSLAIVVMAELADGVEDGRASLAVSLLCGRVPLESAQLALDGPAGAALRTLPPITATPILAVSAVGGLSLRAQGLGSFAAELVRVLALPLLGMALSEDAAFPVLLRAWWQPAIGAPPDAEATVEGRGRRLGPEWASVNAVEVEVPAGWRALRSLEVVLHPEVGLGSTGVAPHPYVFLEVEGRVGGEAAGQVLRVPFEGGWFRLAPSGLHTTAVQAGSFMGGALHRATVFLRTGFAVRGPASVVVTAPSSVTIEGFGPGIDRQLGVAPLPVDIASSSLTLGEVRLIVTAGASLWPTAAFAYTLSLRNQLAIDSSNTALPWRLVLEYSGAYVSPSARASASAQAALQGAFPVLPALLGCSAAPASLRLGAEHFLRVAFAAPIGIGEASRPLVLLLLAPAAFKFLTPVQVSVIQNLPPDLACNLPEPSSLACTLPATFSLVAAVYAFAALVSNPAAPPGGFGALAAAYAPGWALRVLRAPAAGDGGEAWSRVLALCEEIPQYPPALGAAARPFALFLEETQPLFFRAAADWVGRLPFAVSGQAVAVAVTFQPTSARLDIGTALRVTAPVGWRWAPGPGGVDGRVAVVARGTTRDLFIDALPLDAARPGELTVRLRYTVFGGQVYGLVCAMELPDMESDDAPAGDASANQWTIELFDSGSDFALVSAGNFEAVTSSFPGLRLRVLRGCAVLPLEKPSGEAKVLLAFVLASPLAGGEHISILAPPSFAAAPPCEGSLDRAVPLPGGLRRSGIAYPNYGGLPPSVSCSWHTTALGEAELRLTNSARAAVPAAAYLIAVRVTFPSTGGAASSWRVGSYRESGEVVDAPCEVREAFGRLHGAAALAAAALEGRWASLEAPVTILGFALPDAASDPVVTLRAPLGYRHPDINCAASLALTPADLPSGNAPLLPSGSGLLAGLLCVAGAGALPGAVAPLAQPALFLEGVLSFHLPGLVLVAETAYAFGVAFVAPDAPLWRNDWYIDVAGRSAVVAGVEQLRFSELSLAFSFPGLSVGAPSYNDVAVTFALASVEVIAPNVLLALVVPQLFILSDIAAVACAPFRNFSATGGDLCELGAGDICGSGRCVVVRPTAAEGVTWLARAERYTFAARVRNPMECVTCAATWRLRLPSPRHAALAAEVVGAPLVGGVAAFEVAPSHQLGGAKLLLEFRLRLTGRLLARDRIELRMPQGWLLDVAFCDSPLAAAALTGLGAPPTCTQHTATLMVTEMDLPPLEALALRLGLEAAAPDFGAWSAQRAEWLSLGDAPLPLEFVAILVRGVAGGAGGTEDAVFAAASVEAYDLRPNMAPSFELALSTAHLAARAALRVSFRPSEAFSVRANALLVRSSLPYNFASCTLLWTEPENRRAAREASLRFEAAFLFQGAPRCVGRLREAVLRGVLLDTSIKDRVTLYMANFLVPAPPYAAARSSWEVVLRRHRGELEPLRLDAALGVEGPGAFGRLRLLPGQFASSLATGALSLLSFRFTVAVPVLRGSIVLLIAPPGFALQRATFRGVSPHFGREAAESDARLTTRPLREVFPAAPSGMDVEELSLRVAMDSRDGEVLAFDIAAQNPEAIAEDLAPYNHWLLETVDASSDLVVNSNRMSWLSYTPRPGFNVTTLSPRHARTINTTTVVDIAFTVDGELVVPGAHMALEVVAPSSYDFASDCFNYSFFEELAVVEAPSSAPALPFQERCEGFGRLARITGTPPASFKMWRPGELYAVALSLRNGATGDDGTWRLRLVAEGSEAAAAALPVGPAEVLVATRAALWAEGALAGHAVLRPGDRVLVVDPALLAARRGSAAGAEAAVLLADGSVGAVPLPPLGLAPLASAPAGEAAPPEAREQRWLLRETAALAYGLQAAEVAAGVGAAVGSPSTVLVAARLKVSTVFALEAVRLSAPPHFGLSCRGLVMGSLPGDVSTESQPACAIFYSLFATTVQLALAEPPGFQGLEDGAYWWFAVSADMGVSSAWAEGQQGWELELTGGAGELRVVVADFLYAPVLDPAAVLLYFRVESTFEGQDDATFVRLVFGVSADAFERTFGPSFDEAQDLLELVLQVPSNAPLARRIDGPLATGTCEATTEQALFLPRPPAEYCTRVRFALTASAARAGGELQAEGHLPARFEVQVLADIRLLLACRTPNRPCMDFFGLALAPSEAARSDRLPPGSLFARAEDVARQMRQGTIGKDISAARRGVGVPFTAAVALALAARTGRPRPA